MQVWSLGREDPLREEMTTHSSILAGKFHGQRSLEGHSLMGWQRVGHDWACMHIHKSIRRSQKELRVTFWMAQGRSRREQSVTYLAVLFYSQMEPERRCASVLSAPSVFPFSNHHFLWQRLWLFLLSLFFAQSYSEAPQDDNAQKSDQYCSGAHRSHSSSKKNHYLNSLL